MFTPDLDCGTGFSRESGYRLGVLERFGQQELDRDPLFELKVSGGNDDPHPALSEQTLDSILPGQNLSGLDF
jgi:hypothetical protein